MPLGVVWPDASGLAFFEAGLLWAFSPSALAVNSAIVAGV